MQDLTQMIIHEKYFSTYFVFSQNLEVKDGIFLFSSLIKVFPLYQPREYIVLTGILFIKVNPPWEFFIIFIFCED